MNFELLEVQNQNPFIRFHIFENSTIRKDSYHCTTFHYLKNLHHFMDTWLGLIVEYKTFNNHLIVLVPKFTAFRKGAISSRILYIFSKNFENSSEILGSNLVDEFWVFGDTKSLHEIAHFWKFFINNKKGFISLYNFFIF